MADHHNPRVTELARHVALASTAGRGVVRGEVVFPNNIERLRKAKGLTQSELGRILTPAMGVSTISKVESGARRLTNLQIEDIARALGVRADEIPVVKGRDAAADVREWGRVQRDTVRWSVESGAASIAYVLAALRTKHRKTLTEVAQAIGKTISVYHRIEMATRLATAEELKAIADFYKLSERALNKLIEERIAKHQQELKNGVAPEDLLPRRPRALLWDTERFAGVGVLEREALRRSLRVVTPRTVETLPVYGEMSGTPNPEFVFDRMAATGSVPIPDFCGNGEGWFAARVYSNRVGIALRPGSLVYINTKRMPTVGDLVLFVRTKGKRADCAVIVGDGFKDTRLRMYNSDEEIAIDDPSIAEVFRIAAAVYP
ncbi:MAG: helix-turn-helix domain-containing protein [Stellaceae bacterium]